MAFLINGFSFLAVILAYAAMREKDLQSRPRSSARVPCARSRTQLAEGLRYVRRTELVLLVAVSVGVVSTFGMNFGVTIPALADEVLHTDATGLRLPDDRHRGRVAGRRPRDRLLRPVPTRRSSRWGRWSWASPCRPRR